MSLSSSSGVLPIFTRQQLFHYWDEIGNETTCYEEVIDEADPKDEIKIKAILVHEIGNEVVSEGETKIEDNPKIGNEPILEEE
ncbi:hypothetical protein L1987_12415 [Smallanthus sonchifolius]|uniref:Uncharacterized protein n=1 Tax=Smallanthus sonchifolius TaxID=185202 RepID=A0ACB9JE30_9ASTR|nr:hypothetical protein L1987_12415 [Smallanthus sonchifolius]